MNQQDCVLVTGSAGRLGQAAVAALRAKGHVVRGLDCVPTSNLEDAVVANITDPAAVRRAVQGVDTLIHLAATPDDADFLTQLLPNNIVGLFHVLEAAREAGVRRVVLASSGQVLWHRRVIPPWPIGADEPYRPRHWYAVTKIFAEAAGRVFADAHNMEVIAVRLGWCPRTAGDVQELEQTDWGPDLYFSPNDAGRFFVRSVEAALPARYVVVFATSKPRTLERFDLTPARTILGYEPQETWPDGKEGILQSAGSHQPSR